MSDSYAWQVMISSTMRDLSGERAAAERVITSEGLTALLAERPPAHLTGSPYELSREMARTCDLYLLIVGSRYGSNPQGMPADDPRSVTHLEFDIAREANPRKVRVFLPDDIDHLVDPEHPDEFRRFVAQVSDFRNGYDAFHYDRADLSTLEERIHHAIAQWRDTAGRNAYLVTMRDTYSKERNPVTGAEMDADATVLLKVRADVAGTTRRGANWDEQSDEEDGQRERQREGQREGQRGERRGRRDRREDGGAADERIRQRAQPIIKLAGEFLTQFGRLALLGEVGAGKSTLLRRLTYDLARDDLAAQDDAPRRIPVLVRATDLGKLARERPDERWPEVVGLLTERLTQDTSRKPLYHATVAEALYNGQALLLVDGLDEAQQEEQQAVFALLRQVGDNQAILASRPAAYREELTGAGWRVCQAQRLDPGQRLALIAEVFRGVRESADGSAAAGPAPDPAALERELGQRADLFAWAGNPLLLTLIATQFARDARLPESRARIYQFAIEDMRRQRATTARRYFTEEELDRLQRELALRMTGTGARLTTLDEARDRYLGALLRNLAPETTPAILDACAREVLDRSGVLQRVDADRWEFIHLSFREYLAACALAAMPRRDRWRALRNRTLSAQWEQVFFLLVSRLDTERHEAVADALIRELAKRDSDRFPALGGRDLTHATLRLATQLYFSRPARSRTPKLRRTLARCWRPIWTHAMRQAAGGTILYAAYSLLDRLESNEAPGYLHTGAVVAPPTGAWLRRPIPRKGLTLTLLLIAALFMLTFLIGQVTLSIGPLYSTGFGHWIGSALPVIILILLLSLLVWRALVWRWQMRNTAVTEVVQALSDPRVVAMLGTAVDEDLLAILYARISHRDSYAWAMAAQALAALGPTLADHPALLTALFDRLEDAESDVREATAQALAALVPALADHTDLLDSHFDALRNRLLSDSSFTRLVAGEALEALGPMLAAFGPALADHPAIVNTLLDGLTDDDSHTRSRAVIALEALGPALANHPALLDALRARLTDDDSTVRHRAKWSLEAISPALADHPALLTALLDYLSNESTGMREVAIQKLAAFGPALANYPILIDALRARLADDSSDLRAQVIRAFTALGPTLNNYPDILNAILDCLDDREERVRSAAAQALVGAGLGNPRITSRLIHRVRLMAIHLDMSWITRLLAVIQWLCVWPVLVGVTLAQVFALWPILAQVIPLPPIVRAGFGLSAWWQVLLIIAGYLIANSVIGSFCAEAADNQTGPHNDTLEVLESLITRIDDSSRRLKDAKEKPAR